MTLDALITPAELAGLADTALPPHLLDVRWALSGPTGIDAYLQGHLPGAVYVDLATELAAPIGPGTGRHPLPALADLQSAARGWGLTTGRPVVVYDDSKGLSAARAWWLLRWAGVTDVRVLDGGLSAWVAEGLPLSTERTITEVGDVTLSGGALPVLDADQVAELARTGIVLDARAGERYRGEVEPVDPVAGHIPGARSAPTTDNLGPTGAFKSTAELRQRFAALGIAAGSSVGVYCGSGVTAAHEALALARIGVSAALYPGSWSAWITDPDHPIATGAD
jgi:thiosulfate/3-mercaptopyruvate sulfurtransferase